MVALLGYGKDRILAAVRDMYTEVATRPRQDFHFPTGRAAAAVAGYAEDWLAGIPDTAVESFAGVGCPFRAGMIGPGDIVLDIGAGSGTDALIAARLVGPAGKVWALDMTEAMLAKLRANVARSGVANIVALEGDAEAIPLPEASVDVITSNGVLNLVPDKRRAFAEMFRVLRPGGRVQIADIALARPVSPRARRDPELWAECVVGAVVIEDYLRMLRDAGFVDVKVLREIDYFAASSSQSTRNVAASLGAKSIEIAMRKPERAAPQWVRWAKRWRPRRVLAAVRERGTGGVLGAALSLLACYGTAAVVALLSLMGATVRLHEEAWAVAVGFFALTGAIGVAVNLPRHGRWGPLLVAAGGAALVLFAMFGRYDPMTELAGFGALVAGAIWDWRRVRAAGVCF